VNNIPADSHQRGIAGVIRHGSIAAVTDAFVLVRTHTHHLQQLQLLLIELRQLGSELVVAAQPPPGSNSAYGVGASDITL
jgi:hypothetical protein